MVKYSIEIGLLGPNVRIILGLIFGISLLYAANWVHTRPKFANGMRIVQALSGAGIADLYICIFAAPAFTRSFIISTPAPPILHAECSGVHPVTY
ncbi:MULTISPECIES: DUF2339 domain-containing protein [unclassified Wolbachia]|uniref:DUF2339 domain-containing protein n=1 Tax=unclassified Wolbachia TaxID=2640676 RepID=UPI00386EEEFC